MLNVVQYAKRLRPIDDVLFEKIAEDISVCEEILRVVLENPELQVLSVTPQRSVKNLWGRSVRLAALCQLQDGKTIYHCKTVTDETSKQLENGLTEIYVNTKVNDGSEIAELMACFLQETVENDKFPCLSRRVSYLKNTKEGVEIMCKIVDEYANRVAEIEKQNMMRNFFENGGGLEFALKSFRSLSEEVIFQIYEEVTGSLQTS